MKTLSFALLVLFVAVLSGASNAAPAEGKDLSAERKAEIRKTIVAWLECEECTDGELEAVVKLGATAVPTLNATLQGGPSPAKRDALREHLSTNYKKLKAYEKNHPEAKVSMSQEQYVKTYLENYDALYRVRSAIALRKIGGSDARAALEQASKLPLREDARQVVLEGLKETK